MWISVINKKYLNLYKNEINKAKNNEISKFTAKKANTLIPQVFQELNPSFLTFTLQIFRNIITIQQLLKL